MSHGPGWQTGMASNFEGGKKYNKSDINHVFDTLLITYNYLLRTHAVKIGYHMCILIIVQSIEYELRATIVQMRGAGVVGGKVWVRICKIIALTSSIFVVPAFGGKQSHNTAYHFEMCSEIYNPAKCKVRIFMQNLHLQAEN